jgi:hypothetical protein
MYKVAQTSMHSFTQVLGRVSLSRGRRDLRYSYVAATGGNGIVPTGSAAWIKRYRR